VKNLREPSFEATFDGDLKIVEMLNSKSLIDNQRQMQLGNKILQGVQESKANFGIATGNKDCKQE